MSMQSHSEGDELHGEVPGFSLGEPMRRNAVTGTMENWYDRLFRSRKSSITTLLTLAILLLAVTMPFAYRSFAQPASYDLTVTSISLSPATPITGQAVVFSAVVKNAGSAAVPTGKILGVSFKVNGTVVTWSHAYKSGLAAGGSVTLQSNGGPSGSASWIYPGGKHTVLATADDLSNFPKDSNKTNNSLSAQVGSDVTTTPPPPPSNCSGTGSTKIGTTRGGLLGFANGYRYQSLSSTDRDRYFGVYNDIGAKWFRMNMEGYNMTEFQDIVTRANARGICIVGNIIANQSGTHWADPPDHQAWANNAAAMVSQLKDSVHVWEIWNEQNLSGFWPSPNPSSYADLLHKTYLAIKAVDPSAVVLGGGLAPQGNATDPNNAQTYWKAVYNWNKAQGRSGSAELFDGLAHHPYFFPGDPTASTNLQDWSGFYQTYLIHQNIMCNATYGGPTGDCTKRIWGTEGGFPTECTESNCQTLSATASYLPKMLDMWMNDWGSFTGPYMMYETQDQPGAAGVEAHFGAVRTDWTLKDPLYSAYKSYAGRTN